MKNIDDMELAQALRNLDSDDVIVRADAIHILGMCGQAELVGPQLTRMLEDGDELVRAEAADAIGVLGHGPAVDTLRARLRREDSPLVRAALAETLGDLGDAAAIPELIAALDDPDAAVRGFAANALGLIGGAELLPIFEQRLGVESAATVRAELQGGRYRLGADDALPALLAIVDDLGDGLGDGLGGDLGGDLGGELGGELGVNVLNLWDDLTSRHAPPTLASDAPLIIDALTRAMHRIPALGPHARQLVDRLRSSAPGAA